LFYDFDPLQGLVGAGMSKPSERGKGLGRISAIEVAIRAGAKRFLAHTVVVQMLKSVWAGEIVFSSAADNMHRQPPKRSSIATPGPSKYGAVQSHLQSRTIQYENGPSSKGKGPATPIHSMARRLVTIYDPSDASVFKLSRLRVPRYRQMFSTVSYAIMLGLFIAVLVQRSIEITGLELIFWFWSAGYMLDELVGFSEQGFGLYIISVWNAFDIGILLMFMTFYILRIYGILMPDRHQWINNTAYDVLAATAVLLLPRLFSVLDHYKYFSQLLIAFRMMAVDLIAVMILITISCSGFAIAFTLSFAGKDMNVGAAAYALFQILMGYTPAAWEIWDDYNVLGKLLLTAFLIICHFLIVTILITVLTNSFMAVVQNANDEHQYLFAVNTISMVKSDALFAYIPPTNILAWLLSPLRFCMPFRTFVYLNRTMIKATHFPILLGIFIYERLILSPRASEPTDLIEQRGRQTDVPAFSLPQGALFSPGARLREPSVVTYHKEQVLNEVFRRQHSNSRGRVHYGDDGSKQDRFKTAAVRNWMHNMEQEGSTADPQEEDRDFLENLEQMHNRPQNLHRSRTDGPDYPFTNIRSANSDPEDGGPSQVVGGFQFIRPKLIRTFNTVSSRDSTHNTDQDGDDELGTNDNDEDAETASHSLVDQHVSSALAPPSQLSRQSSMAAGRSMRTRIPLEELDDSVIEDEENEPDPVTPVAPRHRVSGHHRFGETPEAPSTQRRVVDTESKNEITSSPMLPRPQLPGKHNRTTSSATMLFNPLESDELQMSTSSAMEPATAGPSNVRQRRPAPVPITFGSHLGNNSHRRTQVHDFSSPLLQGRDSGGRKPSYGAWALDLASELGDNRAVDDVGLLSTSMGSRIKGLGGPSSRARGLYPPPLRGAHRPSVASGMSPLYSDDNSGNHVDPDRLEKLIARLEKVGRVENEVREMLSEVRRMTKSIQEERSASVSERAGTE
jgi:Ion transport protein